jgi:hypothetical protein
LAGVNRVQRAEHEVTGFRRAQGDAHGFAIAHFADQNDLGSLAQRGAQTGSKTTEVRAEFALVERGLHVRMHIFDRVFQRDDVDAFVAVDFVQDRRERG